MKAGYAPAGAGRCKCRCGEVISTNAFARAAHERTEAHMAWAKKQAPTDAAKAHEERLDRACADLVEGQHAPEQPMHLRRGDCRLRTLEDKGLATYTSADGWRLTPAGQVRAANHQNRERNRGAQPS
jgi:hypothetical protein